MPFIILGGLIAIPLVLGLLLKVSASHLFFSVMAGELLARYFGHDAFSAIESVSHSTVLAGYSEAIVLTLPMILTAIFLKGSISRGKTFLHILPFIITGIVYAAFMIHVLPQSVQDIINGNQLTSKIASADGAVIGFVILFQLVALWLLNRGGEKKGKKGKK